MNVLPTHEMLWVFEGLAGIGCWLFECDEKSIVYMFCDCALQRLWLLVANGD